MSEDVAEFVHSQAGTFADFDGYGGGPGGDVVRDHDSFGLGAAVRDEGR